MQAVPNQCDGLMQVNFLPGIPARAAALTLRISGSRFRHAAHGGIVTDVNGEHISDHDLERYYLGTIPEESAEVTALEEHLLWCHACRERAEEAEEYVDTVRATIIEGNWDLNR